MFVTPKNISARKEKSYRLSLLFPIAYFSLTFEIFSIKKVPGSIWIIQFLKHLLTIFQFCKHQPLFNNIFVSVHTCIKFSSLGPDVSQSVTQSKMLLGLIWCDSGWWRYQLNPNWWCHFCKTLPVHLPEADCSIFTLSSVGRHVLLPLILPP